MPKLPLIYQKIKTIADKEMEGQKQIDRNKFLSSVSSKFRLDKEDVRKTLKEMKFITTLNKQKLKRL